MSRDLSPPFARPLRAMTVALLLCPLGSCLVEFAPGDSLTRERELRSNLSVAEAALAAGQPVVARRLYLSLTRRFGDAAEPRLGLGHIALRSNEHAAAEAYFLEAAELGRERPATGAQAMLGAARAALAQGEMDLARQRLQRARALEPDTPLAASVANAIAVLDTLAMDYRSAEASYGEALRLSSGDPRIAANLVRMLLAAGRIQDAAANHAQHDPSYWLDGDGAALARLIEDSRRMRRALVCGFWRT
ncbi:MAG: tetratricopeptide repeat protein [Defluviicoccus sp.]|nr:tetratricopeptide repeat protein [Defluviicoccus sp.]